MRGGRKGEDASKLHHALSCCMPWFGMHPPEGTQRGSFSDHAREKGSRAVFALLEICSALTETLRLIDGDVAWLHEVLRMPQSKGLVEELPLFFQVRMCSNPVFSLVNPECIG